MRDYAQFTKFTYTVFPHASPPLQTEGRALVDSQNFVRNFVTKLVLIEPGLRGKRGVVMHGIGERRVAYAE